MKYSYMKLFIYVTIVLSFNHIVASQCLQTAFGINYETDSKDKYPVTSGQLFNLFTSAISTPVSIILFERKIYNILSWYCD